MFTIKNLLLLKFSVSFPFYLVCMYDPNLLIAHNWLLQIEAFQYYQSRIFYLLALYRNMTQLYFAIWGFGAIQRKFIYIETVFDFSVILLYVHEYFRLKQQFNLGFVFIHMIYAGVSYFAVHETIAKSTFAHEHVV